MGQVSNEYISSRTRQYVQAALIDGLLVSPEQSDASDGICPKTGSDLDTPSSFISDMNEVWTLDLGLSDERESEISSIVLRVVSEELPEELTAYL